jgi:Uma2 family endonuclease
MRATNLNPYLTPEEYLAKDRQSEERYEYYDGQIYAMTGSSHEHDFIVGDMFTDINLHLRGSRCTPFTANMRVRVTASKYTYPDLSIVCGEPEYVDEHVDTIANPVTIVEVLSPSTAANDRGRKSMYYRNIPSLREYIIVAQDEPFVTVHRRLSDETWTIMDVEGLDGVLTLPAIGCTLHLHDIYRRVTFS